MFVARELLLPVRAHLGMRSGKGLPRQIPLDVVDADGQPQTLMLAAQDHPAPAMFPEFELPQMLKDGTTRAGIGFNGIKVIGFGVDLHVVAARYWFRHINPTTTFRDNKFPRFLAKWAYCEAVFEYGVDRFEDVYVIDDILGRADTVGTWVGADGQDTIAQAPGWYSYELYTNAERNVLARLKLFSQSDSPEYLVLVGRLKPAE